MKITANHFAGRTAVLTASLIAVSGLWSMSATSASAQTILGRVDAGQVLLLDLDQLIAVDRIVVEIDGVAVSGPFVVRGDVLELRVPEGLVGIRHDVRVLRLEADGTEELGAWLFETDSARQLVFGTIQSETGVRATRGNLQGFAIGTVRLEFDRGDGQARGRLVLSRDSDAGENGRDAFSVDDIFVETRRPAFGGDLYLRLGNSDVVSNTSLLDDQSRRGLTARFASPNGSFDVSAFVLGTEVELDLDNVLGLADSEARIGGMSGILRPETVPGLRIDVAAFKGKALNLPDDTLGDVTGAGLAATLPFAAGRGDVSVGVSETTWLGNRGRAYDAAMNWQITDPGSLPSLAFGLELSRVDAQYFSALNPDLIRGETEVTASLEFIDPMWQWRVEAYRARTNTNGSEMDPTDQLTGLSANLTYDPGDFTGGFLNGTLFFANASIDKQDRIETPIGAAAPEDNTIRRLAFGMEKVQPRYNWAWSIALDDLKDRADLGADQSSVFVSGRLGLEPTPDVSAAFFANIGQRSTESATFDEAEASVAISRSFENGLWEAGLSAGYLFTEDPDLADGRFVEASVSRRLNDAAKLVAEARWGRDSFAPKDVTDEGWSVGLFLRTDFAFSRN